jgi:hypothetical protein
LAKRHGRKCFDRGGEPRHRFAISRKEIRQRFAVREVEAATAGQQELAAGRRHPLVDCDARATLRQHLGRHQTGRSAADDGNVTA